MRMKNADFNSREGKLSPMNLIFNLDNDDAADGVATDAVVVIRTQPPLPYEGDNSTGATMVLPAQNGKGSLPILALRKRQPRNVAKLKMSISSASSDRNDDDNLSLCTATDSERKVVDDEETPISIDIGTAAMASVSASNADELMHETSPISVDPVVPVVIQPVPVVSTPSASAALKSPHSVEPFTLSTPVSVSKYISNGSLHNLNNTKSVDASLQTPSPARANPLHRVDLMFSPKYSRFEQFRFATLKFDVFTEIQVSMFDSPSRFYVQILASADQCYELYDELDRYGNEGKLVGMSDTVKVSDYCLVRFSDKRFYRGKILKIGANGRLTVRCLDTGLSEECNANMVYELPEELLEFMNFQAIPCRMLGIQTNNGAIWEENTIDVIYDRLIEPSKRMFVQAVRAPRNDPITSYSVVLVAIHNNVAVNVACKIVNNELGMYDDGKDKKLLMSTNFEWKPHVQSSPQQASDREDESESEDDWDLIDEPYLPSKEPSESDVNSSSLNEDDFDAVNMDSFVQMLGILPSAQQTAQSAIKGDEVAPMPLADLPTSMPPVEYIPKMSAVPLHYMHKSPRVEWQQTSTSIKLIVQATDVTEEQYAIDVTEGSFYLW